MPKRIDKILVKRGMAMGDTLMGSAVLKPLKEKYPDAEIHYMTNFPGMFCQPPHKYPYAKLVREPEPDSNFDLVLDFSRVNQTSMLEYGASFIHLCCAHAGVRFNDPEIFGKTIKTGFSIGICPGAGRLNDIWPPEKFQELINLLHKDGFRSISFGPKDSPRFKNCHNDYPRYDSGIKSSARNEYAYGAEKMCRDVNRTARIMRGLDVVVVGDTGLFHVAASVLTPTVLLLTKGSPQIDFWSGTRYGKIVRSGGDSIENLVVGEVYHAVRKTLFERGELIYNG